MGGSSVPVIDRRYPLSEVAEAIRYLEEGHAKGKAVITWEHNKKPNKVTAQENLDNGKEMEEEMSISEE